MSDPATPPDPCGPTQLLGLLDRLAAQLQQLEQAAAIVIDNPADWQGQLYPHAPGPSPRYRRGGLKARSPLPAAGRRPV